MNADNPDVSIVMCTFNTLPFIEKAVHAILGQTYTNWELIISDDASNDGTREWLRSLEGHPKIRIFFQETNLGYVANKNFALQQAKGKYITQNDSDDVSEVYRLERQLNVCRRFPDMKIIASGYNRVDNIGNVYQTIKPDDDIVLEGYDGKPYPFWFPPLLVHREVYDRIGYFTSYFAGMGDDLYWTVKANELYKIYCLKDVLYSYRDSPNSITNVLNDSRKLIVTEMLKILLEQRKVSGTDWLQTSNWEALNNMEAELLRNKKVMSEKYRIWAAKAIDNENWSQARKLLGASFGKDAFNKEWYKTLFYLIRKRAQLV